MANTVSLVTAFLNIIDAVYKQESLTARMDPMIQDIPFTDANAVKVMKLSAVGLFQYPSSDRGL